MKYKIWKISFRSSHAQTFNYVLILKKRIALMVSILTFNGKVVNSSLQVNKKGAIQQMEFEKNVMHKFMKLKRLFKVNFKKDASKL